MATFYEKNTIKEIMESPEYKANKAEIAVYDVLDIIKNPSTAKTDLYECICALGALVGEISAQINGYFDDNEIDLCFSQFIR